jgi:hypothetical protein
VDHCLRLRSDVCDRPVTVLPRGYDIGAALSRVCQTLMLLLRRPRG